MTSDEKLYDLYDRVITELSALPLYLNDDGVYAVPEWMLDPILQKLIEERTKLRNERMMISLPELRAALRLPQVVLGRYLVELRVQGYAVDGETYIPKDELPRLLRKIAEDRLAFQKRVAEHDRQAVIDQLMIDMETTSERNGS